MGLGEGDKELNPIHLVTTEEKGTSLFFYFYFLMWAPNEPLFTLKAFLRIVHQISALSRRPMRSYPNLEVFHDLIRLTGQDKQQRVVKSGDADK